jgi:hypothetical protein
MRHGVGIRLQIGIRTPQITLFLMQGFFHPLAFADVQFCADYADRLAEAVAMDLGARFEPATLAGGKKNAMLPSLFLPV